MDVDEKLQVELLKNKYEVNFKITDLINHFQK